MTFWSVLVPTCWLFVAAAENVTESATGTNGTVTKSTHDDRSFFPGFGVTSSMIQRALYVLIGITLVGMFCFLIRAVR